MPTESLKRIPYKRPWTYPKQAEFIDSPARITMVEASTKVGKTTGCYIWLTEVCMLEPDRLCWWIAPTYDVATYAFNELRKSLKGAQSLWRANLSEHKITFINGSVISFRSADKPENLWGAGVHAVVIDEATRCKEDVFAVANSVTTQTRGRMKIISNVRGTRNWAYLLARTAETGTHPDMAYFKLTIWDAVDAGLVSREHVETIKSSLSPQVFAELYECVPSEDGGNPFGVNHIADCVGPLSTSPPAVWGWDVAKNVDWTVGVALDRQGRVCRFHRWQKVDWPVTANWIREYSGNVPAIVDGTGIGNYLFDDLKSSGNFEPFVFTIASKQELMGDLAFAIQGRKVEFPDNEIRKELDTFQYEMSLVKGRYTNTIYSAPAGFNDDCVMALALANRKYRELFGESQKLYGFYAWDDDGPALPEDPDII